MPVVHSCGRPPSNSLASIPDGDRFQLITTHDSEELIFDPDYLAGPRPDIVYIQIAWVRGRSDELKQALFRRIADTLSTVGVRPQDLHIVLLEHGLGDLSVGNGEAQLLALGAVAGTT
ncbi:MAG TPA: tautomerase family protein [Mycobacteriales bacterium]|jgi:hypothetical protein|nr:tautomerase family protein [Mycobacteriales bacterium]